ncbi:MAG: D-amino acid aminotransferase [Gammaproteobacteria bacterium]|nr:D-amino acid aminotransferase [Gammaproteobacteria bacterium]
MSAAYLNGEYKPLDECQVSVLDRGFIFGDAVYELIPFYIKKAFRLEAHLARLKRSLAEIRINNPQTDEQWQAIIERLISQHDEANGYVYIQVSRGVARRDHAFPKDTAATVFAMLGAWPALIDGALDKGLSVVTVDDIRWNRCDVKSTSLLANVLMKQKALESDAHEAIMIREGKVLEGSATNTFVVHQGTVFTAAKDNLILPGITRDVVVELINTLALPFVEQAASLQQLQEADEVWLTSSTKECLAITEVDGQPVANGQPGPLWHQVYAAFQLQK